MHSVWQKRNTFFVLLLVASILSVTFLLSPKSYAAYDGGRIIDDTIFLDANSMSKADIRNFLVSKGSGLKDKKFTLYCSGTSSQERRLYLAAGATCDTDIPASEIIYYAAQIYGLNPQVILATLQKEQSLVTDPDPSDTQLKQAMGYACPDSGSCSSSSTFGYQIDNGTWALRYHFERARGNMTWWYTSTSWTCGSKKNYYSPGLYPNQNVNFYDDNGTLYATIYIQNAATSSLYCYTPHAYNNPQGLYGRAVFGTTGMYYSGSYNFVVYFEKWFSSTHVADYHWKPSSQAVYTDDTKSSALSTDSLVAGVRKRMYLTVRVLNDGMATWRKGNVFLGTSSPNDRASVIYDASWPSANRAATINEDTVAPGEYATFSFWAISPASAGTYREYFNVVSEGVTWMNDNGLYFPFVVSPQRYTWSVDSQQVSKDSTFTSTLPWFNEIAKGETLYVRIMAKNTGNMTWYNNGNNPVKIATSNPTDRISSFCNASWGGCSRPTILKEPSVAPGATGTFEFQIQPQKAGNYNEYFRLVAEGKTWFNDIGMFLPFSVKERQYQWQLIEQSSYSDSGLTHPLAYAPTIHVGDTIFIKLRVKNVGNIVWNQDVILATSNPRDRLSAFYNSDWVSSNRAARLQQTTVQPGDEGTYVFKLTASKVGTYREYFTPVWENQQWFNDLGLYIPITVN